MYVNGVIHDNTNKTGLNGYMFDFSVDYNTVDISNIVDIRKYLTKKQYKIMFALFKQLFIVTMTFTK